MKKKKQEDTLQKAYEDGRFIESLEWHVAIYKMEKECVLYPNTASAIEYYKNSMSEEEFDKLTDEYLKSIGIEPEKKK